MAARYWVPNAVGAWNNNANWDAVSGGPGPASFPVGGDNAFFNAASLAGACTLSANAVCDQLDCNGFAGTLDLAGFQLTIATNLCRLNAAMTFPNIGGGTVLFTYAVAAVVPITSAGKTFFNITFNGNAGARFQAADAMHVLNDFTITQGTFETGNFAITVDRDMLWNFAAGTNYFTAGASVVTIGRNLDYDCVVATQPLVWGTSSFVFNGSGRLAHLPVTVRNITFYDLSIANAGGTTTLNIAGASTCVVNRLLTAGTGTAAYTAGVLQITGAGSNPFVPNAACTWRIPFEWIAQAGAGIVNIYPCTYNIAAGTCYFRFAVAAQSLVWRLLNNIIFSCPTVEFGSGAIAAGQVRRIDLNGFNFTITGNVNVGSAAYSLGYTWIIGTSVLTVNGNIATRGISTAADRRQASITGVGRLVVTGNYTHSGISVEDQQHFDLSNGARIVCGGTWNASPVRSFIPYSGATQPVFELTAGVPIVLTLNADDLLPNVLFSGGATCVLPNGFNCENLDITAGLITAGNPFTVRGTLTNGGTFTGSGNMFIGTGFINTGIVIMAGSDFRATEAIFTLSGVNPVTLRMAPTCLRLQLQAPPAGMTIGSLIFEDRYLPGVVVFQAARTFTIGTLNSQISSSDGPVQLTSSTAGTQYNFDVAVNTSNAQLWPRDNVSAGAAAMIGNLTNRDLGNNVGWTLNTPGKVRMIVDDPGRDELAAGLIGSMQYCWLVGTSLGNITALAAAFAAGANNYHRKTNIPFATLDNLNIGGTYFIAVGLIDDRGNRLTPNIAGGDFVPEVIAGPAAGGGAPHSLHVQTKTVAFA